MFIVNGIILWREEAERLFGRQEGETDKAFAERVLLLAWRTGVEIAAL